MNSRTLPALPTVPAASQRLYFLDWLRIAAFAVLVLYHVGMYYVRWDFHIKSPFSAQVGPALEPWMKLTEPWRMSLLQGPGLFLLPIASLFAMHLGLASRYPQNYSVVGDWFSHARYFSVFLTGAVLASRPALWLHLTDRRWLALGAALLCWGILVGARPVSPLDQLVTAVLVWCDLVAAFGFAQQQLDFDHPWRQRLVEAVFPVYILHQTLIILASQVLLPLQWQPALEAPVIIVATFTLSYAGYLLVRRWRVLRPWFGLRTAASS